MPIFDGPPNVFPNATQPEREFAAFNTPNPVFDNCCEERLISYSGEITADVAIDASVTYRVNGATPSHYQVKWRITTEDGQEIVMVGDGPDVLSQDDQDRLTAIGFTVAGTETYANLTDITVPTGTIPTVLIFASPDCCNFVQVYFGPMDNQ